VTHPFHPWCAREFVFIAVRQNWGEDRVFFFDDEGVQRSLPRGWTDARDADPFVVVAAGRSALRVEDLVALTELIAELRGPIQSNRKGDCAASVRRIVP
jgi:hypothetical protein